MSQQKQGQCLCGKVQIKALFEQLALGACHCGMCRKWTAGPFMEVACQGNAVVVLNGQENVKTYQSSEWAERAFCNECGTHLFYRLKEADQYYLNAWIFDDLPENLPFTSQVYIDRKPNCYEFTNQTQNFTEADILAMINQTDQS